MRTENQNPALDLFGHLLAPKGRYPARYVDIFWNRDDALRVKEVEVIFIPRREVEPMLGEKRADEFWREYAAYNGRWESDLGNSTSDWLTDKGYTPEDIFGHLLRVGFASEAEAKRALEEFAHIEECEWARLMLRGFLDE